MAPPVSKVGNFFRKENSQSAVCKECLREVKFSGNTMNLMKHLKVNHGKLSSCKTIVYNNQKVQK